MEHANVTELKGRIREAEARGDTARWTVPALGRPRDADVEVEVRIVDVRLAFGRLEVMVAPVAGKGSRWVREDAVHFDKAA